ncbi:TPA: ABC transporter permease [Streptococcus suis]|nr:ABC transporter permease [Streptococcus suis]HEM5147767.1 ABC transporter permease [Streptococcus suis]HEM5149555.1 ABC transporter permease [Streptococcus suis]HEM5203823.1 ABC transporter permease [Streptococcus suis]HEM5209740.1 ABC transporter permease [Streptococcus suis]
MKSLFLVAKETYLRQVKSWSFVLMVFAPFLMIFFSLGIGYLTESSMDQGGQEIALISQDSSVQSAFEDLDGLTLDYTDEEAAQKALKDEDLLGYLTVTVTDGQLSALYHGNELPSIETETAIQQTLTGIQNQLNKEDAQLTSQQEATLARTPDYQVQLVEDKGYEKIGKFILFFALSFLLYVLTIIYASTTAQEVASEKGTKIMEVIFSSVPASTYFYGRILGIFMVITTHLGIYALGGLGSYQFASLALVVMRDNPIVQAVLGGFDWFILFFILFGLVLIVVIAALCGSLVVRQEDVNKAVQPVMYPIIIGFIGAMTLGQQAQESILLKVGSYVPLLSTFFMPIRIINGWASGLEAGLSLVILIAATVAAIYFIGKSYAGLILQTDDIGLWKSLKKGLSSK